MELRYLWQCYRESAMVLVGSGSLDKRLNQIGLSMGKLQVAFESIPSPFAERAVEIFGRYENCEELAMEEKEKLAKDILELYTDVCVEYVPTW